MDPDQNSTLEFLENDIWSDPEYDSHLVLICHALRRKPLKDFEVEDLRIMVGQNIGLEYLIPIAIKKLTDDILVEGDMYEGDLLTGVLKSQPTYWKSNKSNWGKVCSLFEINRTLLDNFDTSDDIKQEWINSYKKFKDLN